MIFTYLYDELFPVALYAQLKECFKDELTMLFESVVNSDDGNFSFISIGVKERITYKENKSFYFDGKTTQVIQEDPFTFLKKYYKKIDFSKYKKYVNELGFNFVDGFIGYIGYDMVKVFEPSLKEFMEQLKDPITIPDLDLVRPKVILAYSHKSSKLTLLDIDNSNVDIVKQIKELLKTPAKLTPFKKANLNGEGKFAFAKEEFEAIVKKAKEHIKAGDIFQIVLSNRYVQKGEVDALSFYRMLRSKNPSPYLFLLEFEDFAICGSSPEVMVRLTNREILLRPIAGTRKRGSTPQRDYELEVEMINDPKERAEHLMLVDLGRNDVGRVAKIGSVKVPEMMRVERYSHVMHLVSDVIGVLDDEKDMFDLFAATFTAGTVSGAPKIKAMELIAKYEGLKRAFYSGSVGYFSFSGDMDSAIVIRTALLKKDEVILQAGAGIVADSIPKLEELEVRNKLMALMATLKEMENLTQEDSLLLLKKIEK